jgi:hypothetical protein
MAAHATALRIVRAFFSEGVNPQRQANIRPDRSAFFRRAD